MGTLENRSGIAELGAVGLKYVAAATQLTRKDRVVHITTNGTYTISLPPVGECLGLMFTITQVAQSGTNTVSVKDYNNAVAGDSYGWTNQVINAANESVAVISDGHKWIVLQGQTS